MTDIAILSESALRSAVGLDIGSIDRVEEAIASLATDAVVMPPILSLEIADANGEVDVKTAYVPGLPSFAIKISSGFFNNPDLGLPSLSGMMALFSARTGIVEAILLDNGYLTDVRTAAAGAVAARHLARTDAARAAILGTGLQARLQLEALSLVRPITHATIWGRSMERANTAATELCQKLGIEVTVRENAREAVAGADIIVTTTPSHEPILMADWLEPGQHVTAMGSDAAYKNELDPHCIARADLYVADRIAQVELLGELRSALAAGTVAGTDGVQELGEIVAGKSGGRRSASDITICDLTGMGVQDTAIAIYARDRAAGKGSKA